MTAHSCAGGLKKEVGPMSGSRAINILTCPSKPPFYSHTYLHLFSAAVWSVVTRFPASGCLKCHYSSHSSSDNRCLIELFCGVVCVVTLPFWHFCWCRGFCHRTESDLFLFLSFRETGYLFHAVGSLGGKTFDCDQIDWAISAGVKPRF